VVVLRSGKGVATGIAGADGVCRGQQAQATGSEALAASSGVCGQRKAGERDGRARVVVVLVHGPVQVCALRDLAQDGTSKDGERLSRLVGIDTADLPVIH